MTDITVLFMFVMAIGVTVMLTIFGIAMLRSAQQAEKRTKAAAPAEAAPAAAPAPAWAPPRYDAAPTASAGPSIRVGLAVVQPQVDSLLLTWNAVNDGSEPVLIVWGPPQVRLDGAGGVQLWYSYTPPQDGPLAPPETRLCAPGEIVSRTVTLPAVSLGGAVRGLKLNVIVGFGKASNWEAVCEDPGAFAEWQQMAVSLPRTVPV